MLLCAVGPLYVQRPFYPEGEVCHCYLLHPPGGIAGGDELEIEATLDPGTAALLTTPAATKFYRSAGPRARLVQRCTVDRGARAEWLPQENLVFAGAVVELSVELALAEGARLLALDVTGLGRPCSGEAFTRGRLEQRLRITAAGQPLLRETLTLDGGDEMQAPWGLGGATAYGALYAYPGDPELVRWLSDQAADETAWPIDLRPLAMAGTQLGHQALLSVTAVDGLLIVRARDLKLERLKRRLEWCWHQLRQPVLGHAPQRPRIWNT